MVDSPATFRCKGASGFMRIDGSWRLCDDAVKRPTFWGEMIDVSGRWIEIPFLANCGADRTVLSRDAFDNFANDPVVSEQAIIGIGGRSETWEIQSILRMKRADGVMVRFHGTFAVSITADLEMSFLGRDITNHLALIVDRPNDIVCLLSRGEIYQA